MKSMRILLLALLIPFLASAQETGAKKPLVVEDLYLFDAPKTPALSSDGKNLIYVRSWIDPKTKKERNSLWLVAGTPDKRRPLEKDEPDARNPIWSPDGRWIAFLSTRKRPDGWIPVPPVPPESDPAADLWLISVEGGTAMPLGGADKPHGRVLHDGFYGRIAFSHDGKRLVFVADDGKDPRAKEEIENGVTVVRPDQGEGYTGYGPAQIWIADLKATPDKWAAEKIHRVTNDDTWYGDPQWSPDGSTIVVHANKTEDRESVRFSINKNFDLWAIDAASGKQRQLTHGPGPDVSPRFAPDGKKLAFITIPRKGSHRETFSLGFVPLDPKEKPSALFDHHGSEADKPPHPAPAFPLPEDCWEDGSSLLYNTEKGPLTLPSLVNLKTGKGGFVDLLFSSKAFHPPAIRRLSQRGHLTPSGNHFLSERLLTEGKAISWENEGFSIEGILTVPPAEIAKPPYKLLLFPHGGPHSRSTLGFDFTVQIFAANGYAVLQPNFRGSAGYGQKFSDADRNDFGGGDFRDCLKGIDHLIAKGMVDKDRLFIYGTSYGGFMTTWAVTHTDRFRAAAAQNAVTDLNMMWALSDIQSWTQWEFEGLPWEVPEKMRKHSPLTHVAKVKTPTLILHAEKDRRVPLPMGKAFYQALLARGVPTRMVMYPDEGHGIRQPRHREDVLRRVLAWFEKHDKK